MNFFENIERRNSYYEDCLELNPLIVKDQIDVPKNKYLQVGGFLSEFKTKSSRDQAKQNLGLNDFIPIIINNEFNLDFINKSGTYIISGERINLQDGFPDNNLENIKAQLIVFNNSKEISQILFLNDSGILLYKRNGNILKDGSIIWENWDTNQIKNNSITLDKLSQDVTEKINSTGLNWINV